MTTLPGLAVTLDRPGRPTLDLTPDASGLTWSTVAVGGYGEANLTLAGDRRRHLPHLAMLRVTHGARTLYEGRVEDVALTLADGDLSTSVRAFGLQRLLDDASVRRVWTMRNIGWATQEIDGITDHSAITKAIGQVQIDDLTKIGVKFSTIAGASIDPGGAGRVYYTHPSGLTIIRFLATLDMAASTEAAAASRATAMIADLDSSIDGITWTTERSDNVAATSTSLTASIDEALTADTNRLRLVYHSGVGGLQSADAPTANDWFARWTNIRLLGTTLTEDAAGGFYGGTILRDLIGLVPGLTLGVVETGDDFTIQQIERAVRTACRAIVEEVAGYYTREWAVWDDGRFDWKTPSLDAAQWLLTLADLASLNLEGTVEGLTRTGYVLFTNAADDIADEASADSTDQRNPYVKQGRTKDVITSPGFPMTDTSADQLAAKVAADTGAYPPTTGRVVIDANRLLGHAQGQRPAYTILSGENVTIGDLPTSDPWATGRDGQTLFHIVSTEANLAQGTVTLELEGQSRRSDVLLARLAAATRTVTG